MALSVFIVATLVTGTVWGIIDIIDVAKREFPKVCKTEYEEHFNFVQLSGYDTVTNNTYYVPYATNNFDCFPVIFNTGR